MGILSWIGVVVLVCGVIAGGVYLYRKYKGATPVTNAIGKIEAAAAMVVVKTYLGDVPAALLVCAQVDAFISNHVVTATDVTENTPASITSLSAQIAVLQQQIAALQTPKV
jgi:hypothetical protein